MARQRGPATPAHGRDPQRAKLIRRPVQPAFAAYRPSGLKWRPGGKKMAMFKKGTVDWKQYRADGFREVDFHRSGTSSGYRVPFAHEEAMAEVERDALDALRSAHAQGVKTVLFRHGCSTSRPGRTTSRSVVRSLMRSKEATPYICRSQCIQHESVFVAAIRSK
jgi:hypothetical protein